MNKTNGYLKNQSNKQNSYSNNNFRKRKPITNNENKKDTNEDKFKTPEPTKKSEPVINKITIKKKIIPAEKKQSAPLYEDVKIFQLNETDDIQSIIQNLFSGIMKSSFSLPEKEPLSDEDTAIFKLNDDAVYEELKDSPQSLQDLIKLGKMYQEDDKNKYAFNFEMLNNIIEPLEELNNVIGMNNVKKSIVNQLIYFLLNLEPLSNMLHTVIQGPPGIGKTMLGQIIAKIYHKMGIIKGANKLKDVKFKIYKRADLIGQYLGHTANKTQKAIDECIGGVMFIDEAYSLGNNSSSSEKNDSFSKECIDTLNQNLSERAGEFVCIIAGYADELDRCFFSVNEGLRRRFIFRYTIDKYIPVELAQIFIKKIKDYDWNLTDDIYNSKEEKPSDKLVNFIKTNLKEFPYFAGDIETLLFHVKIAHGMRIFGKNQSIRKNIDINDLNAGLGLFKIAKDDKKESLFIKSLYL
jgi:SpoVK/Ycf46/Vps4 family AAA+-type ATPase